MYISVYIVYVYVYVYDIEHCGFLNNFSITFPILPTLFKEKILETYLENICTIWPKHKRKCVAVSLLILISFT